MTTLTELIDDLRTTVADARVLEAIAAVPRDAFVEPEARARAYENVALPIGCGQTISQPLVVARMLEVLGLSGRERVLDVGTGSGYHAALLARLAGEVFTVERHAALSRTAAKTCAELGITNITFEVADGAAGWGEHAPYDAINVAAAGAEVPSALVDQLAENGRLVMPLGTDDQRLVLLHRSAKGRAERTELEPVRFVPLVSERPG